MHQKNVFSWLAILITMASSELRTQESDCLEIIVKHNGIAELVSTLKKHPKTRFHITWDQQITDEDLQAIAKNSFFAKWFFSSLDLSGCKGITDNGLQTLTDRENLVWLDVSNTNITDNGLRNIAKLKNLKTLKLNNCANITDEGLKARAVNYSFTKNLELLKLENTNITDAGLQEIAKFKSLKSLALCQCKQITGTGFVALGKLKELTKLYLDNCNISNEGLEAITTLQNLQSLGLASCKQITSNGFCALSKLKNLTWLSVACTKITNKGLQNIAKLKDLTSLNLDNCLKISSKGFLWLSELNNLEWLSLYNCNIKDTGIPAIAKCKKLITLDLSYCCRLTTSGFFALEDLKNLRYLYLNGCFITDEGLTEIARANPLKELSLIECSFITSNGLQILANSKHITENLEQLNCEGSRLLCNNALPAFSKFKKLKSLNLHYLDCSFCDLDFIEKCINLESLNPNCKIEVLDLSCKITSEWLQAILQAILKDFYFPISRAGKPLAAEVFLKLANLKNLCHLALDGHNLTNEGLAVLAALPKLETLYLDSCGKITAADLKVLAHCTKLKKLELRSCNQITKEDVTQLQEYLPTIEINFEQNGY